jgi:hypothetical protein
LPDEILPLSDDRRNQEDMLRWETMYEPVAQRIINLFTPDEVDGPDSKRTSLQRLAYDLGVDVETVRAGLVTLLVTGDFTASHDPNVVTERQVFEIRVDWDLFGANRVSIGFPADDD